MSLQISTWVKVINSINTSVRRVTKVFSCINMYQYSAGICSCPCCANNHFVLRRATVSQGLITLQPVFGGLVQCATVSMQYKYDRRRFLHAQHGVLAAPQLKSSCIPFGMEIISVPRVWHVSDIKVSSESASTMWMIRILGLPLEERWSTPFGCRMSHMLSRAAP